MDISVTYEILNITIRSIISITALYFFTRIMGKKQISQLTYFDYVVGISIGTLAASMAINNTIKYYQGITAMIILTIFPLVLSYMSMKNLKIRKFLEGTPTILIQNGKIVEKNLKKAKLTINDLLKQLRYNKVFNIANVEFAILETSGKLSVELKSNKQPVTPSDLNITTAYKGLCINLIIDGEILNSNLISLNKEYNWLINELKKQDINSTDEVLLAYLDYRNILHIDRKNSDPEVSLEEL
ncbi:MAG: DUF421 domain-containing protein [Clostridia bacterium]|nr:DUF421 domain-containing protein [Clostridia bacterium]